jgi:hypothetical protein
MKNLLLFLAITLTFAACSNSDKEKGSTKTTKESVDPKYLITKDGIGELMKTELEKLLKGPLVMLHAKDTGEIWVDTATANYNDIEVMLYFQKPYTDHAEGEMELFGIGTSSPKCRTSEGIGVGDDRSAVLSAYADNPINMGPESIMINDTTWGFSKSNYYINVNDEKWDKQLTFLLVNKKISKIEAVLAMGE